MTSDTANPMPPEGVCVLCWREYLRDPGECSGEATR
jgi:hypothetical protein